MSSPSHFLPHRLTRFGAQFVAAILFLASFLLVMPEEPGWSRTIASPGARPLPVSALLVPTMEQDYLPARSVEAESGTRMGFLPLDPELDRGQDPASKVAEQAPAAMERPLQSRPQAQRPPCHFQARAPPFC